jgi:maltose O-acetyltransferase
MKGVRIGRGAVIANSSLVSSDIPSMAIAAGMPAKVIRIFDK